MTQILHTLLELETTQSIQLLDLTPQLQSFLDQSGFQSGQLLVFSRHTTTALAVNEYEERLLRDIQSFLRKLAPPSDSYLHNDLHLRSGIPEDEPRNAHAHLMAMVLNNHEIIPIVDERLALGTYQSVFFCELDGPRKRTVSCQLMGLKGD